MEGFQTPIQIAAQVIGFFALGMSMISFQKKSVKGILTFQMIANVIFTLHFFLLGAYTGAALSLVSVGRNFIFFHRNDKKWASHRSWLYFFMLVAVVVGVATWQDIYSLFAVCGLLLGSISFWLKEPNLVRRMCLPTSLLWIVYSVANRSLAGLVAELMVTTSVLIGIFRLDRKKTGVMVQQPMDPTCSNAPIGTKK